MTMLRILILVGLSAVLVQPAAAQCLEGEVTAAANTDAPEYGAWAYTLSLTWDTDVPQALSHLDFIIDDAGGTCQCSDIADAITFAAVAGSSDGVPDGCLVEYECAVECDGDPSIDVPGTMLKWEPMVAIPACEPGPTGVATLTFYSDLAPAPIDDSLPLLIVKYGGEWCEGAITGWFPGLSCNPVATEPSTWSDLKAIYDR